MPQYIVFGALAVAVVAIVAAAIALVQVRRANRRLDEVTPDVSGLAQRIDDADAAETLSAVFAQLQDLSHRVDDLQVRTDNIENMAETAVHRIGLVRYDANDEISGQLSFALCLLDGRENGLMLTSIYDMDSCRVFVRGILHGTAQHELMPEEQNALKQALGEQ